MAERVCCSYQNVLSIQNRVCCLYRVSTTKQVDHDDQNQADIPVQRKACREFAERMGWTIVYEEQENGVSGFKVSANDRDKIQLIKEYAEQGKFDILLVFMFDRIGRRAEETPFVVEWLINHGIQVWSVNEGEQRIDTHVDHQVLPGVLPHLAARPHHHRDQDDRHLLVRSLPPHHLWHHSGRCADRRRRGAGGL